MEMGDRIELADDVKGRCWVVGLEGAKVLLDQNDDDDDDVLAFVNKCIGAAEEDNVDEVEDVRSGTESTDNSAMEAVAVLEAKTCGKEALGVEETMLLVLVVKVNGSFRLSKLLSVKGCAEKEEAAVDCLISIGGKGVVREVSAIASTAVVDVFAASRKGSNGLRWLFLIRIGASSSPEMDLALLLDATTTWYSWLVTLVSDPLNDLNWYSDETELEADDDGDGEEAAEETVDDEEEEKWRARWARSCLMGWTSKRRPEVKVIGEDRVRRLDGFKERNIWSKWPADKIEVELLSMEDLAFIRFNVGFKIPELKKKKRKKVWKK